MRFDSLLWHALLPGRTSFTDGPESRRLGVRLSAQSGETVLFFRPDQERFRAGQQGVPLCDLLVFFRRADESQPRLLFVELKGSEVEQAHRQLEETHRRVSTALGDDCGLGQRRAAFLVVRHGSAPASDRIGQKRFRIAGSTVHYAPGPKCDLREYLE